MMVVISEVFRDHTRRRKPNTFKVFASCILFFSPPQNCHPHIDPYDSVTFFENHSESIPTTLFENSRPEKGWQSNTKLSSIRFGVDLNVTQTWFRVFSFFPCRVASSLLTALTTLLTFVARKHSFTETLGLH